MALPDRGTSDRERRTRARESKGRRHVGWIDGISFSPADCQLYPTHKLLPALAVLSQVLATDFFSHEMQFEGNCGCLRERAERKHKPKGWKEMNASLWLLLWKQFSFLHIKVPFPTFASDFTAVVHCRGLYTPLPLQLSIQLYSCPGSWQSKGQLHAASPSLATSIPTTPGHSQWEDTSRLVQLEPGCTGFPLEF